MFSSYLKKLFTHRFTKNKNRAGFTLPELLIVMTVMAGLAAVMVVSYPASQRRSRDTRRRSDIKQYQTAFEVYYNRQNAYPVGSGNLVSQCGTLGLSGCPDDPVSSNHYRFFSNTSNYVMFSNLQQPPTPVTYFVICSNGKTGESTTAPSSVNCPLP